MNAEQCKVIPSFGRFQGSQPSSWALMLMCKLSIGTRKREAREGHIDVMKKLPCTWNLNLCTIESWYCIVACWYVAPKVGVDLIEVCGLTSGGMSTCFGASHPTPTC